MEKKRLLLVDDVNLFIQLQISFLGRSAYEIHTAASGQEALAVAAQVLPELIVLDYIMPDLTGDQVCRRLKQDPVTRDIPVIIISSVSGQDATRRCMEAGCSIYLLKPIRRDLFICAVEKHLGISTRACTRVSTSLPCRVRHQDREGTGTITSLSITGAFVELEDLPIPGDDLEVDFKLPHLNDHIVLAGKVTWAGHKSNGDNYGAGVMFHETGLLERELIRQYVRSLARQPGAAAVSPA